MQCRRCRVRRPLFLITRRSACISWHTAEPVGPAAYVIKLDSAGQCLLNGKKVSVLYFFLDLHFWKISYFLGGDVDLEMARWNDPLKEKSWSLGPFFFCFPCHFRENFWVVHGRWELVTRVALKERNGGEGGGRVEVNWKVVRPL